MSFSSIFTSNWIPEETVTRSCILLLIITPLLIFPVCLHNIFTLPIIMLEFDVSRTYAMLAHFLIRLDTHTRHGRSSNKIIIISGVSRQHNTYYYGFFRSFVLSLSLCLAFSSACQNTLLPDDNNNKMMLVTINNN